MIGETISHYRITDKLGAGGMGVVYKAQDLQLERFVALKFLPHDLALSESDRERFLREARSASALDHPNIGVIYGIDKTDDGRMFIVMAYYDGQTLSQKLTSGPLSLRQAMDWSCQIAAGLAAAHARNIVHRDIKPSNIIITKDNSARIVDFGLARVVATPSATMTGGTTGTLPYMSPEQILGEALDQRCDVWALSILLVQMVTGSHPFGRDNTTAMTFAILNQPPAAIEALPALLQPIVLHGLAKDVAHRYPDAKEVLADLESARAQFTTSGIALDEPTLTQSAPPAGSAGRCGCHWRPESTAYRALFFCGASGSGACCGVVTVSVCATARGEFAFRNRRRKTRRGASLRQYWKRSCERSGGGRLDGFADQQTFQSGRAAAIALGGAIERGAEQESNRPFISRKRFGSEPGGERQHST